MKTTLLTAIIVTGLQWGVQAQHLEWVKQLGGTGTDEGYSIAVDAAGNVYTTGGFTGTADFDPGMAPHNLTSAGGLDIFVSKLDASGNFLWVKQLGGAGGGLVNHGDKGNAIALDASGNIYITGWFSGTADFDPGPDAFDLTAAGDQDIFVSKLDASGNFVWAKRMGGEYRDIGHSIVVDTEGHVYITGEFRGTADFGTHTLTPPPGGSWDAFISKLDASGNVVWVKQLRGSDYDTGNSIAVDGSGNVYTTGYFYQTADFDPSETPFNLTTAGGQDIFVSKLDASGNFVWAKRMGGTGHDGGSSIVADAGGNVYVTGYFRETADFGAVNLTAVGGRYPDIFISRLDASGNFVWTKQIGGTGDNFGNAIALDAVGGIYTTGRFLLTADFDPGQDTVRLTATGSSDVFISRLDASGNFVWAVSMGGHGIDEGKSIALDATGSIYTTGSFRGTADFDPGTDIMELTAAGGITNTSPDVFVHKMSQPPLVIHEATAGFNACVFPNPAHSILNIQTNEPIEKVSIYNVTGALVQTATRSTFSIAQLPAGIYLVRIQTEKGVGIVRVVKE